MVESLRESYPVEIQGPVRYGSRTLLMAISDGHTVRHWLLTPGSPRRWLPPEVPAVPVVLAVKDKEPGGRSTMWAAWPICSPCVRGQAGCTAHLRPPKSRCLLTAYSRLAIVPFSVVGHRPPGSNSVLTECMMGDKILSGKAATQIVSHQALLPKPDEEPAPRRGRREVSEDERSSRGSLVTPG